MKSYGTLKTALRALQRNVMRTMLTMLGIIIGVAAVITMMEIGNGASITLQLTIASVGLVFGFYRPGKHHDSIRSRHFGMSGVAGMIPNGKRRSVSILFPAVVLAMLVVLSL